MIEGFIVSGGFATATVASSAADGFTLGSGPRTIVVTPQDVAPGARPAAVANATAATYEGTAPSSDTVVRATAVGVQSSRVLRDRNAPQAFTWRLALQDDQRLIGLPDGGVAVLQPAAAEGTGDEPQSSGSAEAEPAGSAVTDPERQVADARGAFAAARQQTADEVVAVIERPTAVDAAGASVPARLQAQGDTVTMTVEHATQGVQYPVLAGPVFAAAASAPSPPPATTSFYVGQPGVRVAFDRGKQVALAASSTRPTVFIVHVGTQRSDMATRTPGGARASYAALVATGKGFVGGLHAGGANKDMRVVLATNNSGPVSKSVAQYAIEGTEWAQRVVLPVYAFARANPAYARHISVSGGNDVEVGFGPPAPVLAWEAAFAAASLNRVKLYIDGDAAGCPVSVPAASATQPACQTAPYTWFQRHVYKASWQPDPGSTPIVRAIPQIYTISSVSPLRMDRQWRALSQFGARRSVNGKIVFSGTITQCQAVQYQINDAHQDPNSPGLQPSLRNKPNQGWSLLAGSVQASSETRLAIPPAMAYSSDVSWEWMRPNRYASRCGLKG